MKILVTGSGGLIGQSLTEALLADGHVVVAAYRTSPPALAASDRLRTVRLDLSRPVRGLEPVDVVIHAAAHTHLIPGSTAWDYVRSNVLGTLHLMEYARAVRPKAVICFSTMSVYGEVAVEELDEETALNRPELYGASKYLAELIAREAGGTFPALCVRLPGVVGRGYFTPWIGTLLRAAIRQEPLRIYNPDALFNNIVDLQEIRRFIAHLIGRGVRGCELVNLAASEPMRIREVAALIRSLTGSRAEIIVVDRAVKRSFVIRTARLRERLGFVPSTTQEILQRYVAAHAPAGPERPEGVVPRAEPEAARRAAALHPSADRSAT